MIDAYRAGFPGNGKPFPDGSKISIGSRNRAQRRPSRWRCRTL
jgi:hypothetical protein